MGIPATTITNVCSGDNGRHATFLNRTGMVTVLQRASGGVGMSDPSTDWAICVGGLAQTRDDVPWQSFGIARQGVLLLWPSLNQCGISIALVTPSEAAAFGLQVDPDATQRLQTRAEAQSGRHGAYLFRQTGLRVQTQKSEAAGTGVAVGASNSQATAAQVMVEARMALRNVFAGIVAPALSSYS